MTINHILVVLATISIDVRGKVYLKSETQNRSKIYKAKGAAAIVDPNNGEIMAVTI